MTRVPAVAGQFYPKEKEALLSEMAKLIPSGKSRVRAIGAVSPHAGYIYSGRVAGEVFSRMHPRKTYVVLSPNHSGSGSDFAVSSEPWKTPLGTIEIDKELLEAVMARTGLVETDPLAHVFEHSAEVQIPFIQATSPGARILPITMQHRPIHEIREVARAISGAIAETGADATIVASSDMTHYESRRSATAKDTEAISRVLALDAEGLLNIVGKKNISMCGCIPTAVMLIGASELGATKAELIKYTDSGEVTGDTDEVVGYAGIIVY